MKRLNKTEALREAGEPLSSADCSNRIAAKHGVAANDPAPPRFLTHVSAGLNSLVKRKRVRQVGTVDGRKNLRCQSGSQNEASIAGDCLASIYPE